MTVHYHQSAGMAFQVNQMNIVIAMDEIALSHPEKYKCFLLFADEPRLSWGMSGHFTDSVA